MTGGLDDTICAVATPPGEGGVGIIRLSGTKAIEIADRLARLRCRKSLTSVRSHSLYLADLGLPGAASRSEPEDRGIKPPMQLLDEALAVVMRKHVQPSGTVQDAAAAASAHVHTLPTSATPVEADRR